MDDFPKATQPTPVPAVKKMNSEEKQLTACKDVISKLTPQRYYGSVTFSESLFPSVLEKLEANGFEVSYVESYNKKEGRSTYVNITDNGLRGARESDLKTKASVNPDLAEGLATLLNMFKGNVSGGAFGL
jgi:hypothetical protein